MTAIIEARPYGPDSAPEELEALLSRVSSHADLVYDRVEEAIRHVAN